MGTARRAGWPRTRRSGQRPRVPPSRPQRRGQRCAPCVGPFRDFPDPPRAGFYGAGPTGRKNEHWEAEPCRLNIWTLYDGGKAAIRARLIRRRRRPACGPTPGEAAQGPVKAQRLRHLAARSSSRHKKFDPRPTSRHPGRARSRRRIRGRKLPPRPRSGCRRGVGTSQRVLTRSRLQRRSQPPDPGMQIKEVGPGTGPLTPHARTLSPHGFVVRDPPSHSPSDGPAGLPPLVIHLKLSGVFFSRDRQQRLKRFIHPTSRSVFRFSCFTTARGSGDTTCTRRAGQ